MVSKAGNLPVAAAAVERLLNLKAVSRKVSDCFRNEETILVWREYLVVRPLFLWIKVLLLAVLLVVEIVGLLLRLVLGLLLIDEVGTLSLGEMVDSCTGEASEELFGETVVDFLTYNIVNH